ncbi:Vitellogenin [Chionoecetes opilio]|uniref:Vitellogenin n=1 Tax=Chionoecetes opilio TaxID=41210 RepID=A0A8J4Y0J2_CHIOP|nr:Vitellogenin [Chionoecetes opilio]
MQQTMDYQETRMTVTLRLTRSSDNVNVIEIVVEKDSQKIEILLQAQPYGYLAPIKVAIGAVRKGEEYNTEALLMYGNHILVELSGPVSYIDTPSHTRLVANIKFNNMYHFGYISEFREGKEAVLLEIKRQEEILVYLQFINLNTMSPQRSLIEAKVNLPPLIDGEVNGFITEGVIHISTNTLLLPRSSAQRRIKAFTDISWDNKQGQVMVLWDADQDPSKKITVDAIIVPESGSPAQATMDVKIILLEKTYNVSMKVVAPFLLHQYRERNSISMEVKTPEQRKWMFEIGIQDEGSNSAIADLTLRTINNNNYHLTSDLRWKHLEGPFGLEVEAGIGYVSPQNTHGHFSLLAKHQRSPQRHIVQLTMEASTPSIQTPLKIDFCIDNQDYSYTTKLQSSMSSEAPMFQWQLETYPGGGVKHLEVISDMRAIRDVLKAVNRIVNSRGGPLMVNSVFENERRAYRWLYSRPSPDTHSIKFDFPSRSLEAEITYSPSKAGIKIYPNRAASEAKYEVSGEHIISSWGGTSQYVGRMSHPMLSRDMKVVVDMSLGGTSLHGSFQLDVFPDTADKVTGSLSFVHRANNTIVIVTNLSTRVLQVKPKVTVEASWAEHTAAFNFTFQETPSSPESLKVIAKYDRIYRDYAAVTFQLVTEGRPVVDVSGIVEPRQGLHCDGYALLSNVHTSDLGDFIVNSTVCRWAFLDLALNRQNDETIYKTKVGLLSPYKAEMSISETDTYQVRNKYLSLIGIELASPRRLKIDFEYKPQKMTAMKDFMLEEGDRVMEATLSWTDRVCSEVERQAHQAGVPFPDPEIRALVEEAKNDILKILVDVLCNDLLREWDVVMQILNGPTATFITEVFYQTLLDMAHMQRELALHVSQQINKLKQLFRPAISEIIEAVVQAYQWVQTGEEPEMVRRLVNEVQRTNLYQIFQTHVIEPIKESYPHQYQATKEVVAKVIDSFRHDLIMLQQKVWASPTLRNTILKIIDLTQEDMLRETLEWCMSQVTQKILFVAPEPGTYHVGIQVPLYQPTYSLTQVANMMVQSPPSFTQKMLLSAEGLSPIPVTKIMETYYVWMPAKLSSTISPFNRSALVVNDTEILTFDGASLRAPRSPCKVLLASVTGEASVYMSHSQTSEALEITFQTGPNKAIIKPNMEVDINGRTVHGRQTVGDLVIEVTPLYVTLVTPLMGVQRSKDNVVMVNVSSWTFNHTKGLLGSYDNERANDRMMSNGRNATSLRGLVASWQENPDCPTPPITPINPAQVPVKESVMCDFIFFQLRPCEPVVSPKPFIQRCLVDPRPFEVAHAYVSFCRMHGVKFPLSIF